jgi:hypothetical protein
MIAAKIATMAKGGQQANQNATKTNGPIGPFVSDNGVSITEIAEHLTKHGKQVDHAWVSRHLRFGRFLSFFVSSGHKEGFRLPSNFQTTVCNEGFRLPANLTERAFRGMWERPRSRPRLRP